MFWCWRGLVRQPISVTRWYEDWAPGTAVARRSSSRGAQGNTSRFHLDIWTRDTGSYQFRRRRGHVPSHLRRPLWNATLLGIQMQALWTRKTHGGASLFCVIEMVTLLTKGKTWCSRLQKRSSNKSPVPLDRRRGTEPGSVRRRQLWKQKASLGIGIPFDTLTHTRRERERETVLLGSKNSEARHTRRVFESGMKHVCSIYMMEFYVFLCKHEAKAVREEKRHPPRCLLHYVCGSTILYVV